MTELPKMPISWSKGLIFIVLPYAILAIDGRVRCTTKTAVHETKRKKQEKKRQTASSIGEI
jgi:hypothetical protein